VSTPQLTHQRPDRYSPWDVHCGLCGTRIAVGTDLDATMRLAAGAVTARPCCPGQVTDGMVSDYWLDREPPVPFTGRLF
jgi:hypothetical protein